MEKYLYNKRWNKENIQTKIIYIRFIGLIIMLTFTNFFSSYHKQLPLFNLVSFFYACYNTFLLYQFKWKDSEQEFDYELLGDIIMISLLIFMRGGLRSDVYLCYLMVLGYAAISKRLRVIIILSVTTLFSYSVVTILGTIPQLFSFGRLIIRLISIIIIITILTDVNRKLTAEKMTREKAAEMALIDSLTGVYSRSMIKYIADYYDEQTEDKYVAMLDIDDFKQVNDKYGHQFGDQVLKVLGQIILEAIAEDDICIRYGGEEFLIVINNNNFSQVLQLINKLKNKFANYIFRCGKEKLTVTISGGLTVFKKEESIEEAISRADESLYKAKETGKNKICNYGLNIKELRNSL